MAAALCTGLDFEQEVESQTGLDLNLLLQIVPFIFFSNGGAEFFDQTNSRRFFIGETYCSATLLV